MYRSRNNKGNSGWRKKQELAGEREQETFQEEPFEPNSYEHDSYGRKQSGRGSYGGKTSGQGRFGRNRPEHESAEHSTFAQEHDPQAQEQDVSFEGGQLTALSVQKGNPDRLSLFVDERFAFGVRREVAYRHHLKKGMEVTTELLLTVWRDEESYRARDVAARYLERRARTSEEMRRYLSGKSFDEVVVAETIAWLTNYGYLDDSQFAKQWVENRMKYKPRGKAMLRWELQQKGVASNEIEQAFAEELGERETEVAAAVQLLRKKVGRKSLDFTYEEQSKLAQFLARRGFTGSIIRESIRIFRSDANLDND